MSSKLTTNNDENDKLLVIFWKVHDKWGTIWPISEWIFTVKERKLGSNIKSLFILILFKLDQIV
jgi:hypothetical protein